MEDREGLVEAVMARVRVKVERRVAELEVTGPPTIGQIEALVEEVRVEVGRELMQEILERQRDVEPNSLACPACDGRARFHARSRRLLLTQHGEAQLVRRRYRCHCGHHFAPLDTQLGLDAGATTPWVREVVAGAASDRTFAAVAADLAQFRGLVVSESTIERVSVACAARLGHEQKQVAAAYEAGELPAVVHRDPVVYLGMDGVYAPLRDPWRRDGSSGDLVCRHGECKVGLAYALTTDAHGRPQVAWREYVATFGDINAFRPLMGALAHRCGAFSGATQVFLADTLACNWNLAADYFPDAIQIVDWQHAESHIGAAADAYFGLGTTPGQVWREGRRADLWEGDAAAVAQAIRDLPVLPHHSAEDTETLRREAAYFETHQERMRYATFRDRGFQIASGLLEASCRTVVVQRFDRSGMHWREDNANHLVALRAALLSTTKPHLRNFVNAQC